MHILEQKIQACLDRYPTEGRYVVAVSGGMDSSALLYALQNLGFERLLAVYVHHGLRPSADEEVRKLKAAVTVPLEIAYVDVPTRVASTGESVEAAARALRYEALERYVQPGDYLLTAHHASDQAETVLLHMIRGCGLRGLCGMDEQNGSLIRPMLGVTKQEIEDYVQGKRLTYFSDETNDDEQYLRNWIRHTLLPLLETKNPQMQETLVRMSRILRDEEENRKVRAWLAEHVGLTDITGKHVEAMKRLTSGKSLCLPGNVIVKKSFGAYYLDTAPVETASFAIGVTPWGKMDVERVAAPRVFADEPYTKYLKNDILDETAVIRKMRPNDYLRTHAGRIELKKYFDDRKVSLPARGRIVLLCRQSEVLWIIGERQSDASFVPPEDETCLKLTWQNGGNL